MSTPPEDSDERADFAFIPSWIYGPNRSEQWIWYGPLGTGSPGRFAVFLADARSDMPRIVKTINELRQTSYRTRRTSEPPIEVQLPPWLSGPNPGEPWDLDSGGQFRDACWRARGNPANPDDQRAIGTSAQGVPAYIALLNDAQRYIEDHAPVPKPKDPKPEDPPKPEGQSEGQSEGRQRRQRASREQSDEQSDEQSNDRDIITDEDRGTEMEVNGNPFERSGQWTVQSHLDANGWKGALCIPSGPGREHVTLSAVVPREVAQQLSAAFRSVFKAEHDRLHHVEGMEIIGILAAEIGVPWWQQILPAISSVAQNIPIYGQIVAPIANAAQQAAFGPPSPIRAMPGLSALAQTGAGPQAMMDIPGAPGGLLAAFNAASNVMGPLFGGAGLLAQGAQLVSGNPEHFGDHAHELCEILDRALHILDCHAAAVSGDARYAHAAIKALSQPAITDLDLAARDMVGAMLPCALHVSGYEIGAPAATQSRPKSGRVGPKPPPKKVDATRSAGLWKAAALKALSRNPPDVAHAKALLRGV